MVIYMKIYLDLVFVLNFFFDFLILFGVKQILKENVSLKRLLFGALFGSLTIFFLFIPFNNITLFICKIIMSILIILITFGKRNFSKNFLYFYLVSVILGGSLYLFDISFTYKNKGIIFFDSGLKINFIVILIVSPIIIYLYIKESRQYRNTYSNIYDVKIYINSKMYHLKGMLDTGNSLCDPYKRRSVIILNRNIKVNTEQLPCIYVPYKALNTNGVIKCYKPDEVIIKDKLFHNALIGISKDDIQLDSVDCILPNKFKEDL